MIQEASIKKLIAAAVAAVIYMAIAGYFVREDRTASSGGWINLQGLLSAIVTMPVSFPLEYLGHKMDYKSNWQIGGAIMVCGALVFGVVYGAIGLVGLVLISKPVRPRP